MLDTANSDRLGPNLRALRQEKGLTLDRLASMSELTRGYLSLVERGLKTPSITALLRVAGALEVNIAQLFDLNAAPNVRYTLQRANDQNSTEHRFGLTPLAPGRAAKIMEPFIMRPTDSPGAIGGPRWAHAGEEMIFVVSGRVAVKLGAEEILMGKGDCLYFSGEERHEVRSLGEAQAELLVVIANENASMRPDPESGPRRRTGAAVRKD